MNFYHGTTKEIAQKILNTQINESVFDVLKYLEYVVENKAKKMPVGYKDNTGDYFRTKWLGKGIYLFDEFNKQEAVEWGLRYLNPRPKPNSCTALEIELKDIPKDNIFDLFSYSDLQKMKSTIKNKFLEYFVTRDDIVGNELQLYLTIQSILEKELDNLFAAKPYLGGVAVDLYNMVHNNKILLVRGVYQKGKKDNKYYDVYYCLKDKQYISNIKEIN